LEARSQARLRHCECSAHTITTFEKPERRLPARAVAGQPAADALHLVSACAIILPALSPSPSPGGLPAQGDAIHRVLYPGAASEAAGEAQQHHVSRITHHASRITQLPSISPRHRGSRSQHRRPRHAHSMTAGSTACVSLPRPLPTAVLQRPGSQSEWAGATGARCRVRSGLHLGSPYCEKSNIRQPMPPAR
jgi:hypothetical protein